MAKRKGEKEGMMKNERGRQEAANHVPSVLLWINGMSREESQMEEDTKREWAKGAAKPNGCPVH